MKLTDAQMDRASGVLLGAAVGDALGAGYEFSGPSPDLFPEMIGGGLGPFAPSEWTDDTSMTWGVAVVAARGHDLRTEEALTKIARHFRNWYETDPKDIGGTTAFALKAAGPNPTADSATNAAYAILGNTNGSLMRTAPVALAHLDDPEACVEAAMKVSALTHAGRDAQEACALWSLAIRHAVLEGEFELAAGVNYLPESSRRSWNKRIRAAELSRPTRFTKNGGAVEALQAAWSSIVWTPPGELFECEHLEDTLVTAIRIGHDTDTVASICGALLGARWGMSAIPAPWRRKLHGYPGITGRHLEALATLAVQKGKGGKYGWPLVAKIDYKPFQWGRDAQIATHPFDDGVILAGAPHLDEIPAGVDAVISLCRLGSKQVPAKLELISFRLYDEPELSRNPNLDYVLVEAAETIQQLRLEGKKVLVHCVAAHSRTPTVGIAYAMQMGYSLDEALPAVLDALPYCNPNSGFRDALERLDQNYYPAVDAWLEEQLETVDTDSGN